MRNEETLNKLVQMRLIGMAEAYENQLNNREIIALSFEERLNLLIDFEYSRRQSNKLKRLLTQATFSEPGACIEDIEYYPDRHLDCIQHSQKTTKTRFPEPSKSRFLKPV